MEQDGLVSSSNQPVLQSSSEIDGRLAQSSKNTDNIIDDKDGWEDVIGNSDMQRKILKKGDQLHAPSHGDRAIVNVVGRLESSGEVVEQHKNFTVVLGFYDVVQALDMCIALMTVGEKDLIRTSFRFAYGHSGKPPDIPPYASLVYEVELLGVEEGPNLQLMNGEELLTFATERKQKANYFYTTLKNYEAATEIYEKALEAFSHYLVVDSRSQTLKAQIFNDLAAAQIKMQSWSKAVDFADSCLQIEPTNIKALYRMSVAYASMFHEEKALQCLKRAARIAPENKAIAKFFFATASIVVLLYPISDQVLITDFSQPTSACTTFLAGATSEVV
ncbi:unnamed protein product [Soboliphyme baturini]|uniref:peptidylprolyl isomerase n=1 Tax=Soboliphyme baturini TaxID=241478 RepID=A0A183IGB4_9BILA|nr:unnamed protein product [Soboliphyme baturini]